MKIYRGFFLGLGLLAAMPLAAQEATSAASATAIRFTPDQLDDLLGPIALYPDALIALILPAAASPSDVVLAARFLQDRRDPAQIENQPWDDSVVGLAHYPDVIQWMDQNLAWTRQLGEVFVAQPVDVMQAVQRLRDQARAAGTLFDTPEQQVILDGEDIRIVPSHPDVIYVPRYDPEVVYYVQRPGYHPGPYLTFGTGFSTGLWLTYDVDWGHRRIWVVDRRDRHYDWRDRRDWRHPVFPGRPGYVSDPYRHPWNPPARYPIVRQPPRRVPPPIIRPSFPPGTPPRPPGWRRDDGPDRRPDNSRDQRPSSSYRPGPIPGPLPQPLQSPLPQPLQPPLPQPLQPPLQQTPDRRGDFDSRDRDRDDRGRRGRESDGPSSNRFINPPRPGTPPSAQPPQPSSNRQLPPREPDDDEKKRGRDRRD